MGERQLEERADNLSSVRRHIEGENHRLCEVQREAAILSQMHHLRPKNAVRSEDDRYQSFNAKSTVKRQLLAQQQQIQNIKHNAAILGAEGQKEETTSPSRTSRISDTKLTVGACAGGA